MYAKVYEANAKNLSPLSIGMFGGFLDFLCVANFLYAKYAKFFHVFMWGALVDLSYVFRIFAYFLIIV